MKRRCSILAAVLCVTGSMAGAAAKPADMDVESRGLHVRTAGVSSDASADVRDVIDQQLALTEDVSMSAPLADDLAFFVRQRYLDLGYADARVTWEVLGNAAVLSVTEGTRYTVGTVRYEGEAEASKEEMTSYLLRPTHQKLNTVSDHPPFVEADLRTGAELVQRHMMAEGYIDAKVEEPVFTKNEAPGTQDVLVQIKAGRRYVFGDILVTGELLGLDETVRERVDELRETPFSEVKVEDARTDIVGMYQKKGHFHAAATAAFRTQGDRDGRIPVTYHITPGPQFRIAGIEVEDELSAGARRIAKAGFRRSSGKVYSPAELDVMHRHVLGSEIFSRLEVTPKPVSEDTMILEISGEEAKTRRYSGYAGYETFLGPVLGVEYRKVNFGNTGNALRLKAEANGVGFEGGITWIDPAIFNSSFSLETQLGAETQAVFDYSRQTYLGRAALLRQWDRHISTKLSVGMSTNSTESDALTPEQLGPDQYDVATIGASVTFDYRNHPLVPVDGWYSSVGVTGSFGDVNYTRVDAVFAFYQPLTKKLRFAIGAKTSSIFTSSDVSDVPIDLRVFNGGATSVRSFGEREMGAQSRSGTPLGGLISDVASVELSYEIAPNLELALFGDAGRIRPTDDLVAVRLRELRYAIGLGVRYKLPFGPLRVDYGWNPDRDQGEPFGALHISFGFAF